MTGLRAAVVAMLISVFGGVAQAQQLAVNGMAPPTSLSVAAGSVVTLTISDGPGNTTDWVGLYAADAADANYLDWRYLSGSTVPPASGLSSATFEFPVPSSPETTSSASSQMMGLG